MPPRKKAVVHEPAPKADDCIVLSDDDCSSVEFEIPPPKKPKTEKSKPVVAVVPAAFAPSGSTRSKTKPAPAAVPVILPVIGHVKGSAMVLPIATAGSSSSSSASFQNTMTAMSAMSASLVSMKANIASMKATNKKLKKLAQKAKASANMDTDSDDSDDEYGPGPIGGYMPGFMTLDQMGYGPNKMVSTWDPTSAGDWDTTAPTPICTKRMQKDLAMLLGQEEETKIYINPNENDITRFSALIVGPKDTPYEGGFFELLVRVGPSYPMVPPRVKNLTTGDGKVRFGPNLYADGKVCLSILGTWSGPSWTAAMNLSATLQSIQSLMSDAALRNEPGYEKFAKDAKEVQSYDRRVQYDTLRVALLENLEKALHPRSAVPEKYRQAMFRHFEAGFDKAMKTCQDNMAFDKKPIKSSDMCYMFGGGHSTNYDWSGMMGKLTEIRKRTRAASTLAK